MSRQPLPRQSEDFPAWYAEVVRRAGLAESSSVRGAMVIKPYGFAIWEAIQRALDERIKATGHENVYFPLLIPSSVLAREGELVEGFAPEVAVVTHAGGKELDEPLVVRPTSEALIWATYARWIQSYRDLPLLLNQWANVVRWELRPRLFLRTTEFLWQEGHTAHETEREAVDEALRILRDVYADTAEQVLAMPVARGRKSPRERFPGAVETFTIEALMRDGKALQAGTSHYLGQNFARAYDVRFTDRGGAEQFAYATSWGASTRLVGGLIMAHGDDAGLRLPPAVAPVQVVVVPLPGRDGRGRVLEASEALAAALSGAGVRDPRRRPRGAPARLQVPRVGAQGRADQAGAGRARARRRPGDTRPPRHRGEGAAAARRRSAACAGAPPRDPGRPARTRRGGASRRRPSSTAAYEDDARVPGLPRREASPSPGGAARARARERAKDETRRRSAASRARAGRAPPTGRARLRRSRVNEGRQVGERRGHA